MSIVFKKIFQEGLQRRPFKAHKRYEVTNVNYSSSFGIQVLRAINPNDKAFGVLPDADAVDKALKAAKAPAKKKAAAKK